MNKKDTLRVAGIVNESIVDGPGIRFAVFCQGCPHDCPGCHNPETHDFGGGYDMAVEEILKEFDKDPLLAGITFSGGEPMCQPEAFLTLAKAVKERHKTITVFTGYRFEELVAFAAGWETDIIPPVRTEEGREALKELLVLTDVLIDGPFEMEKRDISLKYRGSSNQRVIDIKKTAKAGKIISFEE
ncbi:MAG: anaerobic ribonucleoside-triphosphate reductase activating protein [Firmicutes bacterium]|nr:anaerobic ribonucleoside-triphosphate reductase activating protein [Bacillota bacterium]